MHLQEGGESGQATECQTGRRWLPQALPHDLQAPLCDERRVSRPCVQRLLLGDLQLRPNGSWRQYRQASPRSSGRDLLNLLKQAGTYVLYSQLISDEKYM